MGTQPSASSTGAGAEQLRRRNLSVLLGHVHLSGPTSRSQLAARTGLNRSTIADLVADLSARGLVAERRIRPGHRPGPSVTGRRGPRRGCRRPGHRVGRRLDRRGDGGTRCSRVQPRPHRPSAWSILSGETVEDAVKLAEPLIASVPVGHHFAGVGVAVVGLTRRADGFVHLAPNLGWRDVPLGEMLAQRLGRDTPISVANEADLGALAEHRRGAAPGVDNLLFVSGEVGIGVGVILGGNPGLGAAGYAGEAGHTLVNPAGVRCRVRGDRMLGDRGRRRRSAAPGRAGDRYRWPGLGRSGHRSCRGRRAAGACSNRVGGSVGSVSASPT